MNSRSEEVIDPSLPIVDAHHHFWQRRDPYFAEQLLADIRSGHRIRGTVYMECSSMYRTEGDLRFASLGEVEFANGVGAVFASGFHGDLRVCAGIVGRVDLTLGAFAGEVLAACVARAPDRFRGIRHMAGWDADPEVNMLMRPPPKDLMLDPMFREGYAQLAPQGLSYDAHCYHPQLGQLIDLIDAFPDTRVIVNHLGGLVRHGPYARDLDATFRDWRASIIELARRPNVFMKIGGMAMRGMGFDFIDRDLPPTSEELAQAWGPFVETCIEAFGPGRCMFESNFPVDRTSVSYRVLWNTFKRLAAGASASEKADLFAATAVRAYHLPESLCSAP
ncbi:MAG: amidohydrolase family protein [Burkholderiaceae bacterium]